MKIGITGHTCGLGKSLFDYYQSLGHECIGFSRSNGYDINLKFDDIVNEAKHCDLFINNASVKQSEFVCELSNYPVDIISMGTASSFTFKQRQDDYSGWKYEHLSKKTKLLDEHVCRMNSSKGKLLLLNLVTLENHPTRTEVIPFIEIHQLIDFWLSHKSLSIIQYTMNSN